MKFPIIFLLTLFISSISLFGQETDVIQEATNKHLKELITVYKHFHSNPELSFREEQTAKRLASELEKAGFTVTPNFGGHGIVAVMENGAGPVVMVRTDLDALPIKEATGVDYASKASATNDDGQEVGVMHACGHDVHMTVVTGVARAMVELKNTWSGTLILIGQPAEEKGAGAIAMIEAGLFKKFPKPDYCLALHSSASLPAGTIGYCEGNALANVDWVDITVKGEGGHGAYPHRTKDPVVIASRIVLDLQTIVSREISPIEPAVVTVGSIHGGTKHNVIPDEVKLQLTLRSYSDEVRDQTIEAIKRITKGVAISAGLPEEKYPEVVIGDGHTPTTYNDPELTGKVVTACKKVIGEENVLPTPPVMGGEDFSYYGRQEPKIPICIYWLGAVNPVVFAKNKADNTELPSLHSALFAPDPVPTISTGVKTMTAAVLELMGKQE